jgi:hypothetical protein
VSLRFPVWTYTIPNVQSHEGANPESTTQSHQELAAWARSLQHWGLAGLVSSFLENGGAFTTLAAQSLYVCQPILDSFVPVRSLAHVLEDAEMTKAFVKTLQDEAR